jgi:hypothetical protein
MANRSTDGTCNRYKVKPENERKLIEFLKHVAGK